MLWFGFWGAKAQQYSGMNGLIHVPSADMDSVLSARIGAHFVHQDMIPDIMKIDGKKYNSGTNYLSVMPFRWVEVGYGYTLQKFYRNGNHSDKIGFYSKDRYLSLRIQPIREDKWWPSIVIGGQDVWGSFDKGVSLSNFYKNNYIAMSKHVNVFGVYVGAHLVYRHWKQKYNEKWNGVVGGVTLQPPFYRPLRLIGEYDGDGVNIGADCLLVKYLLMQASLQKCQYFSGGLCLRVPLKRLGSQN